MRARGGSLRRLETEGIAVQAAFGAVLRGVDREKPVAYCFVEDPHESSFRSRRPRNQSPPRPECVGLALKPATAGTSRSRCPRPIESRRGSYLHPRSLERYTNACPPCTPSPRVQAQPEALRRMTKQVRSRVEIVAAQFMNKRGHGSHHPLDETGRGPWNGLVARESVSKADRPARCSHRLMASVWDPLRRAVRRSVSTGSPAPRPSAKRQGRGGRGRYSGY